MNKTLLLLLITFQAFTQDIYRNYSTNAYNLAQEASNPQLKVKRAEFEQLLKDKLLVDIDQKISVQVVFHLLLDDPKIITDQDIQDQVKILNDAFNTNKTLHPKLARYLGKTKITEKTANIAFDLMKENGGIYRKEVRDNKPDDASIKNSERGGIAPITPSETINIWVVDLEDGNAGYAQWPGGLPATDGIVINAKYISSKKLKSRKYGEGKTIVHLMGSYLGLIELWGKYDGICDDDFVSDTPVHHAPHFDAYDSYHVTLCTDELALLNNYMDNTNDEYLNHFTEGQIKRMHFFLSQKGWRG
jgi:hypothetical protein